MVADPEPRRRGGAAGRASLTRRPPAERVIVALDVPDAAAALHLADRLAGLARLYKVGSHLFTAAGPEVIRAVRARGAEVFLDLKFHDIPAVVAGAVRSAAGLDVAMLTVHAAGGRAMLAAAAEAAAAGGRDGGRRPTLLAVTVLTSLTAEAAREEVGLARPLPEQVLHLARLARGAGLDGAVASAQEARALREALGEDFLLVTPGIRPAWAAQDDQARVLAPREALAAGADYLVVGRPVLAAPDPRAAFERLLTECGP
ncbi:MAG: orotidine-5'-phosphate decarboxylase [candidate division NC10 bacterium]|nr:orotidine-5'-phosphate decarboxylase [candidate division NC10 bacterium]MBI4391937.1 orotidine-5'-phosphate decarboxylase [candidate division NC10 bacterium]